MGSRAKQTGAAPKRHRRGRKLLVLGLLGLGAAAFKALRESSTPAPAAPAPRASTPPTPAPTPAPASAAPIVDVAPGLAPTDIEPVEPPAADIEPVEMPPATEDLHDIVEEPWTDPELSPVTEPPADSLTSFFDEVMTDTAERKLRNGQ